MQTRTKIIKLAKRIGILAVAGFLYLMIFQKLHFGIPCVIHLITGLQCPGCGMTHAMSELWNGNLAAAIQCNALSVTVLPLMCIYFLYRSIREEKDREFDIWEYVFLIMMLIIVVGYTYLRNK